MTTSKKPLFHCHVWEDLETGRMVYKFGKVSYSMVVTLQHCNCGEDKVQHGIRALRGKIL